MIKRIEVDGFKSLSNFSMDIRTGLNILVGPNGSGKTNIVQYFEFISNLLDHEISEAISKSGGAGSILKKIGEEDYKRDIHSKIIGMKSVEGEEKIHYSYEFNIRLSPDNIIYYQFQRYEISKEIKRKKDKKKSNKKILDIIQNVDSDFNPDITVKYIDEEEYNKHNYGHHHISKKKISESECKDEIKKDLKRINLMSNSIIDSFIRLMNPDITMIIYIDLKGGDIFNIIPSEVKKAEDATRAPGIDKNGSGLAATLYAMKMGRSSEPHFRKLIRGFIFFNTKELDVYSGITLKKIIEYVKLANNTISDINVDNDPFNNSLNVKISIIDEKEKVAILPLKQMSDGTIKWITLITAILTCQNIFSIEEPENYLHPWMQSEIVKILRNNLKKESFILMTTHSESLLNSAKPEEIVVVSMKEGKTFARRDFNVKALKKEISNTGFGAGYFYFTGSFGNE